MFTQETCLVGFKEQKIYRSSSSEVFLKLLENSEKPQEIPVMEIVYIKKKCFSKTVLSFRCLPSNWKF